jgi:hypothetical protein
MNININADLNKALEVIGNGLSDTATKSFKFVYPLAVKSVFVVSVIWLTIGLALLVASVFGFYILYKNCKNGIWDIEYDGAPTLVIVLSSFALIFGIAAVAFSLNGVINPQYQAIQNIINMVKPN